MLARLSVLTLLAVSCGATPPRPVEKNPAQALPAVELRTLDGGAAPLTAALHGRPALLSLWATWCESCAVEFGALGKLAPKAEAQGAWVVAISEGEEPATVAAFVRARALGYPQLVDERFAIADAIGARRIPATLVVDRKGRIVFRGAALNRAALVALDAAIAAP